MQPPKINKNKNKHGKSKLEILNIIASLGYTKFLGFETDGATPHLCCQLCLQGDLTGPMRGAKTPLKEEFLLSKLITQKVYLLEPGAGSEESGGRRLASPVARRLQTWKAKLPRMEGFDHFNGSDLYVILNSIF